MDHPGEYGYSGYVFLLITSAIYFILAALVLMNVSNRKVDESSGITQNPTANYNSVNFDENVIRPPFDLQKSAKRHMSYDWTTYDEFQRKKRPSYDRIVEGAPQF